MLKIVSAVVCVCSFYFQLLRQPPTWAKCWRGSFVLPRHPGISQCNPRGWHGLSQELPHAGRAAGVVIGGKRKLDKQLPLSSLGSEFLLVGGVGGGGFLKSPQDAHAILIRLNGSYCSSTAAWTSLHPCLPPTERGAFTHSSSHFSQHFLMDRAGRFSSRGENPDDVSPPMSTLRLSKSHT